MLRVPRPARRDLWCFIFLSGNPGAAGFETDTISEGRYMNTIIYSSLFLLLFSFYFLFIAVRNLIFKKPVIQNSAILLLLMIAGFAPTMLLNISRAHASHGIFMPSLFVLVIFLVMMVFYGFIIKGYTFYGINDEDLRQRLLDALKANNLSDEEKLNKIVLKDNNNEINISCQPWMGTGMIRLKNRKDANLFKAVITTFRNSFQNGKTKIPVITPLFFAVFGVAFVVMSVYFAVIVHRGFLR